MRFMVVCGALALGACGDDASGSGGEATGGTGAGGESASSTNVSGSGGAGGAAVSSGTSSTGGGGAGGAGGDPVAPSCQAERAEALGAVDSVSDGAVSVLESAGGVVTLYVDASAGGVQNASTNPWVYVDLGANARVDLSDLGADGSEVWDIAFKRAVVRSNSGDGGYAGGGGARLLAKPFAEVSSSDAAAGVEIDRWFDDLCELQKDAAGAIATSFEGWYVYQSGPPPVLTPAPGTWLVRSGDGARYYKLAFLDYYATPEGGSGPVSARYRVQVAEVTP